MGVASWVRRWCAAPTRETIAPIAFPGYETEHAHQLGLVMRELARRLESQDRRIANAESRSGVLVGSSAVFAGLLVVTPMTFEVLVAFVVNIAAAGFGIASMFPRAMYDLRPSRVREQVLQRDPEGASLYLIDRYIELIEHREAWLNYRMRVVAAGLACLAGSLVLAAIAISHAV